MATLIDFCYYRCPNAQRRFRRVMDKFMAEAITTWVVKTIEPRAASEFPSYVENHVNGASVTAIQRQSLTADEREDALDFDDDALAGDVTERLVFVVEKNTAGEAR